MDRRTVLERLDAARPGTDDLRLPELADAAAMLKHDEEVAAEFDRRQSLDRRIIAALHDVPIPPGAKERLLAKLSPAVVESRSDRWSRRRVLTTAAAIAATIVGGTAFWTVFDEPSSPMTVAEARAAAAVFLAGDTAPVPFDLSFDARQPDEPWVSRLALRKQAMGLLAESGNDRAAAWEFSYRGRVRGVLIAIPQDLVETPPTASSIFGRDYLRVGASESVAWAGDGFVYIVAVNGPINEFIQQLEPLAV